jgi:hypothetical protein
MILRVAEYGSYTEEVDFSLLFLLLRKLVLMLWRLTPPVGLSSVKAFFVLVQWRLKPLVVGLNAPAVKSESLCCVCLTPPAMEDIGV